MTAILRSWRVFLLAWAVLLAPQVALVHELSHSLPAGMHEHDGDRHHHVAAKVCATCLAFAHIGSALPSRFEWVARVHDLPVLAGAAALGVATRDLAPFDARGPPADLT